MLLVLGSSLGERIILDDCLYTSLSYTYAVNCLKLFYNCRLNLEKNQARNLDLNQTRTQVHILKMSQKAVPLQILPPYRVLVQHQVLTGK